MLLFDGDYCSKQVETLKGTLLHGPFRKGGGDDGHLQLTVYGNVVHQRVQGGLCLPRAAICKGDGGASLRFSFKNVALEAAYARGGFFCGILGKSSATVAVQV